MRKGAEPAVGQQHVAHLKHLVQAGQLAHLMDVHAHHCQVHDHAGGKVQKPQQLDHGEPASGLLRRWLGPQVLKRRPVGRGRTGCICYKHTTTQPEPPFMLSQVSPHKLSTTLATPATGRRIRASQ